MHPTKQVITNSDKLDNTEFRCQLAPHHFVRRHAQPAYLEQLPRDGLTPMADHTPGSRCRITESSADVQPNVAAHRPRQWHTEELSSGLVAECVRWPHPNRVCTTELGGAAQVKTAGAEAVKRALQVCAVEPFSPESGGSGIRARKCTQA